MRTPLVLLSSFVALALGAATAVAQERPTAAQAAPAASMPMDCNSRGMKRHDHGAERNTGATAGTMSMPCQAADAASASDKATKKKPAHDHAKFHKNQ